MRNSQDSGNVQSQFDTSVVKALLESMQQVWQCWSAGALRWYFTILSRLVAGDTVGPVAHKALGLLRQVAKHLHARQNPFHLVLQTRFGLYGTPLEAELFDQEPPVPAKWSSTPLAYTSVAYSQGEGCVWSGSSLGTSSQSTPAPQLLVDDLRNLLNMKGLTSFLYVFNQRNRINPVQLDSCGSFTLALIIFLYIQKYFTRNVCGILLRCETGLGCAMDKCRCGPLM
ncbi:Baculoviral IAP repeat-containing protein 6 [Homalodisca vitripennis]|nr:Baculoviral IAP repeat-containing protein 6 [Homalodisca vitripennis]